MRKCFFVSDLHGSIDRYEKFFKLVLEEKPYAVFLGGDLLPHGFNRTYDGDFFADIFLPGFLNIRKELPGTRIFVILGNDDPMTVEPLFRRYEQEGVWEYIHQRMVRLDEFYVFGYAYVPPTPFRYKDWERYDVSRYIDPGCISPEEGIRTSDPGEDIEYVTIEAHLKELSKGAEMSNSIFLFHSPPYNSVLDRAALDGQMVDHVPLDVHVGSIAIQRFIEEYQPMITMHGHIHESSSITGKWMQDYGKTLAVSAAWDGPELALIRFVLEDRWKVSRNLY
jgi:Icc-related predicted phosphoesterase